MSALLNLTNGTAQPWTSLIYKPDDRFEPIVWSDIQECPSCQRTHTWSNETIQFCPVGTCENSPDSWVTGRLIKEVRGVETGGDDLLILVPPLGASTAARIINDEKQVAPSSTAECASLRLARSLQQGLREIGFGDALIDGPYKVLFWAEDGSEYTFYPNRRIQCTSGTPTLPCPEHTHTITCIAGYICLNGDCTASERQGWMYLDDRRAEGELSTLLTFQPNDAAAAPLSIAQNPYATSINGCSLLAYRQPILPCAQAQAPSSTLHQYSS